MDQPQREVLELSQRFGEDGEHPKLPRDWWREDLASEDTRLSYWEWAHKEIFLVDGEENLVGPDDLTF